jgi:adenosylcobinamide kinase/adenosylcobinamide-phosphate guanylyltransferase
LLRKPEDRIHIHWQTVNVHDHDGARLPTDPRRYLVHVHIPCLRVRIDEHRARRSDSWHTLDVPMALPEAVAAATGPVLIDCLTLWLTNLLLAEADLDAATEALARACAAAPGPLVLVANEVGLGIVPDNALARRFRDAAGRLHQRLAREADRVVLTVAGLPLTVKPSRENP